MPPRGFTLVEIVLVIAIGVVFFGGAAVLLTTTAGDKDLTKARQELEQAARSAREQALRSGSKKVVVLNAGGLDGGAFPSGVEMLLITPRDLALGFGGWGRPLDYQWTFTGGGLVEPIRVRLQKGEKADQFSFSALTGETFNEAAEGP
jgi:prepilin-type N-terminal cleavage/methylation domain-containing protein